MRLKQIIEGLIPDMVKEDPNKKGYFSSIMENGESFEEKCISDKIIAEWMQRYRPMMTLCFSNSQSLCLEISGLKYFEGWGLLSNGERFREHAWAVKDGKVVDVTSTAFVEYFGVEIPHNYLQKNFTLKRGNVEKFLAKYILEELK